MPADDWFLKQDKRKKTRSFHLCPHHLPLTVSPPLTESPRFLMEGGGGRAQFLRHKPTCSPLQQLRIKATFLFPLNSVCIFLFVFSAGREREDFGAIILPKMALNIYSSASLKPGSRAPALCSLRPWAYPRPISLCVPQELCVLPLGYLKETPPPTD